MVRYVHFTSAADASAIVAARRLYGSSFIAGVYAVEEGAGFVPGVQHTALGRPDDRSVAIVFTTPLRPDVRYTEEVIWRTASIAIRPEAVEPAAVAVRRLNRRLPVDEDGRLRPRDDPRPLAHEVAPTPADRERLRALAARLPGAPPRDPYAVLSVRAAVAALPSARLETVLARLHAVVGRCAESDDDVMRETHDALEVGARFVGLRLGRGRPHRPFVDRRIDAVAVERLFRQCAEDHMRALTQTTQTGASR